MKISENEMQYAGAGVFAVAAVGAIGAHIVKPVIRSISPFGVAMTCALTAIIALGSLYSDLDGIQKLGCLTASYPIAWMAANIVSNVYFLEPWVCMAVGGACAVPIVLTALFLQTVIG